MTVQSSPIALEVEGLRHAFTTPGGQLEVLKGISFALHPGEVVAVLGPSGSGKSTLLHLLGGLETPTGGEVRWGGSTQPGSSLRGLSQDKLAARRSKEVGFVFQHHYLLEDLTALENVMLPSMIAGKQNEARARKLLERVGLLERASAYPRTLSGGERQRCALARALVTQPHLVLADEPTGSLDRANAERVFGLLVDLAHLERAAVVVVTHDDALAHKADRIIRLEDGRVIDQLQLGHEQF
jgi:lipoprotein-releasing system ATP-binding protein